MKKEQKEEKEKTIEEKYIREMEEIFGKVGGGLGNA